MTLGLFAWFAFVTAVSAALTIWTANRSDPVNRNERSRP